MTIRHNPCAIHAVRRPAPLAVWAVLQIGLLATSPRVRADEMASTEGVSQPGIEYRRVMVPADEPSSWPLQGDKYLPIESREFDRLLSAANGRGQRNFQPATLTEATYTGRMQSDGSFAGRGKWMIELRGEEPTLLPLGEPSLIIRGARWLDAAEQPLRLGRWGAQNGAASSVVRNSESLPEQELSRSSSQARQDKDSPQEFWDKHLGIEVTRTGTVEFDWQVPALPQSNGGSASWQLPPALNTRVNVTLPGTYRPIVEGGVILRSNAVSSEADADNPWQRWQIALGPAPSSLQIVSAGETDSTATPVTTCREEVAYSLNERGLDIQTALFFDDPATIPRELAIPLPAGVQFMSAETDGQELSWRVVARDSESADVFLSTANASGRGPQVVTVRAWHPLATGTAWSLPKLRPNNVFWTNGEAELSVAPSLVLQQLALTEAIQTGITRLPDSNVGPETSWFTLYSPTADLRVTVARRESQATVQQLSSLSVVEPVVSGRLVAELTATDGAVHAIAGELAPGWVLAGIETIPADALGDWFLSRNGTQNDLAVQLAQAATANRSITVVVTAQWQRSDLSQALPIDLFHMVRWQGLQVTKHLATIQVPEPLAVEPTGGLRELSPADVQLEAPSLLEMLGSQDRVFDLTTVLPTAALQLTARRGEFDAEIRIDTSVDHDSIDQTYVLHIRPRSHRPVQVLVFANSPLGESARWADGRTGQALDVERIAASNPRRSAVPSTGELWRVRLPRATNGGFEFRVTATAPLSQRHALPLLAVLDASQQTGRVLVRGGQLDGPEVSIEHLQPTPVPMQADSDDIVRAMPPVSAAFRYEPGQLLAAADRPHVSIRPGSSPRSDRLIARQATMTSYLLQNGRALHRSEFQLQNAPGRRFEFQPPAGAENIALWLNARGLAVPSGRSSAEPMMVQLPTEGQTADLTIEYTTRRDALAVGSTVEPPLLDAIRVVSGEWTIWLPNRFVLAHDDLSPVGGEYSPLRRLFGPLVPNLSSSAIPWNVGNEPISDPFAAEVEIRVAAIDNLERQPTLNRPPGDRASSSRITDLQQQLRGWHVYRMRFVAHGAPMLTVVQPAATAAWGVAAFLLCVVIGGPLAQRVGGLFVAAIAIAAIGALALPQAVAPVATGAFVGSLVSLAALWPLRQSVEETPTRTWTRHAVTTAIVLLGMFLCTSRAQGQGASDQPRQGDVNVNRITGKSGSSPESAATRKAIQRVLIPADDQGHAVGTKWYVSGPLLRELYRLSQSEMATNRAWLLVDTHCEGELVDSNSASGVVAGEWKLKLSLEVLARDTTVALPFVRSQANWAANATLDGLPTTVAWRDDGRGCETTIAEPGRYELEMSLVPHVTTTGNQAEITLSVPPVPGGICALRFPTTLAGIDTAGILPASQGGTSGTMSRQLDGSGRLTIRWLQSQTSQSAAQGLRVNELQWLQLTEEDVQLTAKYVVEGSAPRPGSLVIGYDAPWELVPTAGITTEDTSESESRRAIRISIPPDDADRQEIVVQWRLPGPLPLGHMQLPAVGLVSPSATQRWLGLTAAPSLQCVLLDGHGTTTGSADEFLARWADSPVAEELSLVTMRLDPLRTIALAVRPKTSPPTLSESLQIVVGSDGLRVAHQADVVTHGVGNYQFPLEISPELIVDNVTVTQNGQKVPLRWTRANERTISVFFGQRVARDFRLTLVGHVPHNSASSYALPRIAAPGTRTQSVQIYRADDVLVEIAGLGTETQEEGQAAPSTTPPGDVRLVAVHSLPSDSSSAAQLVVKSNEVQSQGQTVTSLEHDADAWWATFDCRWTVSAGELSTLRLRAPTTWSGPFEIVSNVPAVVDDTIGADNNTSVVVRLSKPIAAGEELSLRLRGRLSTDATTNVAVPQIVPHLPIDGPRLLIAPATIDSRPTAWTATGVRVAPLPNEFVPPNAEPTAWKCWQADAANFHVALDLSAPSQPVARVRLADIQAIIDRRGRQLITSGMVLVAPDATEIQIEVPPGQELVGVTANGQSILSRRLDDHRWQLAATTANLPHWVEIVTCSQGGQAPAVARVAVARPRLWHNGQPVPVELSLWSVGLPSRSTGTRLRDVGTVSGLEQAALRIDRLAGISEIAMPVAMDLAEPAGHDWYVPWVACLNDIQRRSLASANSATDTGAAQHVEATPEMPLERALERLNIWLEQSANGITAVTGEPTHLPIEPTTSTLAEVTPSFASDWLYSVADGDVPQVAVDVTAPQLAPKQKQVGSILLVVGATLTTLLLQRLPAARDCLCRWPHATLSLVGLAYWLWLWPSWFGLLLAAGSVWLKFRAGWPGRMVRVEGSTVVRAGKPG